MPDFSTRHASSVRMTITVASVLRREAFAFFANADACPNVRHRGNCRRRGHVPGHVPISTIALPLPSLHHAREGGSLGHPRPNTSPPAVRPFENSVGAARPRRIVQALRFLKTRGRALLLLLEPGTVVPRHRHLGEVHGFNLQGERELIESGAKIVGPGGYVYEPPGNVDSWRVSRCVPRCERGRLRSGGCRTREQRLLFATE
jgi:hypothetical protein